jgi:hypothetical protein
MSPSSEHLNGEDEDRGSGSENEDSRVTGRTDRQRLFDGAESEKQAALEERDSTIADLGSLLDRRRRELDGLEQSIANTQDERTRLQLHSTEMSTSLVAVRQELEDARAIANAARVAEETGRQQLR